METKTIQINHFWSFHWILSTVRGISVSCFNTSLSNSVHDPRFYVAHAQKAEALESGTKQFEELEFCQLEEESSLEEKKEAQSSQLLQERAEYHCSVARRKVGLHLWLKSII